MDFEKLIVEYWLDDGWFVGKLVEFPGVFSQGKTLTKLKKNLEEVFCLMAEENALERNK